MRYMMLALAMTAGAGAAGAENRAVIIGNVDYRDAPDLAGSDTAALARAMREAGFNTAEGIDQNADEMRRSLDLLARPDPSPDARIVMLSGRFLNNGGETWFMGTEAQKAGPFGAATQGVPLGLVMQLMAATDKGSVLLLGTDRQRMPHDEGIASGIGELVPPEGISVMTGTPEATARALRELAAGGTVGRALSAGRGLELLPEDSARDVVPVRAGAFAAQPGAPSEPDRTGFADAMALDTIRSYSTYLERFPSGHFATAARERRASLRLQLQGAAAEDHRSPAETEVALGLDRARLRGVQVRLAEQGLKPGPTDGVFGAQTRNALRIWQRANSFDPTGYLTEAQLTRLQQQATNAGDGQKGGIISRGAREGIERLRAYLGRSGAGASAPADDGALPATGNQPERSGTGAEAGDGA